MKIELHEIPVREVAEGYVDSAENGVRGYGGRTVASETATETQVTLEDTKPLPGAAFYRVVVSVP